MVACKRERLIILMKQIEVRLIRELRSKTGFGIIECKEVLEQTDGDIKKAIKILLKRGTKKI